MRQSYHGQDEFIKWAPGMKTLDDALAIRRSLIAAFEMAESLPTAEERRPWLTFAVAGGGPTGVELAGQIRELAMHALTNEFRSIDPDEARVLLFHGDDRVLPSFSRKLSAAAKRTLDGIGVETHLGVHVTDVCETSIETTDKKTKEKRQYETRTILWTAGVEAVPFAEALATALGVKQVGGGRIEVEADLTVPGHPNVYVVGDLMSRDKLAGGVAEVAMQGGRTPVPGSLQPWKTECPAENRSSTAILEPRPTFRDATRCFRQGRSSCPGSSDGCPGGESSTSRSSPVSATAPARCSTGGRNPGVENASGTGNHVRRPPKPRGSRTTEGYSVLNTGVSGGVDHPPQAADALSEHVSGNLVVEVPIDGLAVDGDLERSFRPVDSVDDSVDSFDDRRIRDRGDRRPVTQARFVARPGL